MWPDLRYALRSLRKTPGFTIAAVLCLALGIGANTAIFTLIDAALLRMLPVADPEQLVIVQARDPRARGSAEAPGGGANFSYPQYVYLRDHTDSVAGVLAYASIDLHLSTGDLTDAPKGLLVSDTYFPVLGVQPAIGRAFTKADEHADVAVLSYRYWRARFEGDPAVVGRTVSLNGLPFTIVGVAPRGFFGVEVGRAPDVFVPLTAIDRMLPPTPPGTPRLTRVNSFWLGVMARLRPDVAAERAAAQADVIYHQSIDAQAASMPPRLAGLFQQRRIAFVPGARGPRGLGDRFGTPLLILMTVVGFVLLIACANVANLLLARAAARRREIAVRLALGAGRWRLVRQLLIESLTLSVAGGTLGLVFAVWSARGLTSYLSNRVLDVDLDLRVLGFTLMASILTGVLFGGAPALVATRPDLTPAFRGEASAHGSRRGGGVRAGRLLVAGQVALSLLLLVGAGLFIRTLGNLRAMDHGFRGDHVLLARINPGLSRYTPDRARGFYDELLARVSALPGVHAASLADAPLLGGAFLDGFRVESTNENVDAAFRVVSPRFLETMGIEIRRGRDFAPTDRRDAPSVAIVNETIARRYFANVDPVGQFITLGKTRAEIVGVIADTKYLSLRGEAPNTLYLPLDQAVTYGTERTLHVRTFAGPERMAAAVREQVRALDRHLPVTMSVFSDLVDENLAQERLIATLSGFFGGLALLLTAIGLYGVIAYTVQRRTREIGIRMSLGAARATVLWMVLRDALLLIAAGVVAGTIASVWLSRLVARQLFGIAPNDVPTMIGAAVFLMAVATLAGYVPARRASRVDPTVALRHE